MGIGRIGIWTSALDRQPAPVVRRAAPQIEQLGYGARWVGEAARREAFANASLLLAATDHLVVATGIANIWVRDPMAMAAGRADGARLYRVPVEHPDQGREILGPGKLLCPEIAVVVGSDPQVARRIARSHLDAGADHVAIEVRTSSPDRPPVKEWCELATFLELDARPASLPTVQ